METPLNQKEEGWTIEFRKRTMFAARPPSLLYSNIVPIIQVLCFSDYLIRRITNIMCTLKRIPDFNMYNI